MVSDALSPTMTMSKSMWQTESEPWRLAKLVANGLIKQAMMMAAKDRRSDRFC